MTKGKSLKDVLAAPVTWTDENVADLNARRLRESGRSPAAMLLKDEASRNHVERVTRSKLFRIMSCDGRVMIGEISEEASVLTSDEVMSDYLDFLTMLGTEKGFVFEDYSKVRIRCGMKAHGILPVGDRQASNGLPPMQFELRL